MPRMTADQWWSVPPLLASLSAKIALLDPPSTAIMTAPSYLGGNRQTFLRYWAFLNFPSVTDAETSKGQTVASGWFYDRGRPREWPKFQVQMNDGRNVASSVEILSSEDLVEHFADAQAGPATLYVFVPVPYGMHPRCPSQRRI